MSKAIDVLMKKGFSKAQATVVIAQLNKREGNKNGNDSETTTIDGSIVHPTD